MTIPANADYQPQNATLDVLFGFLTHEARALVLDRMTGRVRDAKCANWCGGSVQIFYVRGAIEMESVEVAAALARAAAPALAKLPAVPVSPVDYDTMTDAAGNRCYTIETRAAGCKYVWTADGAADAEARFDAYVSTLPKSITLRDGRVIPQRAGARRVGPATLCPGCSYRDPKTLGA